MNLFSKDPFGYNLFIKKWLIRILGVISYRRFNNNLIINGSDIINNLPDKNVLFISNHQTYFADVTAMFHVFNASLKGRKNSLKNISYIWRPKLNLFFIAAKETMKSGLLPKILAYTGSISIERTWRENGKSINRSLNKKDIDNVKTALKNGWLITFPQGTTKKGAPIRKGTAHIIKENEPIIIPIVIEGFDERFDKTGIKIINKETIKSIKIKDKMNIDYKNETVEDIIKKISQEIEI